MIQNVSLWHYEWRWTDQKVSVVYLLCVQVGWGNRGSSETLMRLWHWWRGVMNTVIWLKQNRCSCFKRRGNGWRLFCHPDAVESQRSFWSVCFLTACLPFYSLTSGLNIYLLTPELVIKIKQRKERKLFFHFHELDINSELAVVIIGQQWHLVSNSALQQAGNYNFITWMTDYEF